MKFPNKEIFYNHKNNSTIKEKFLAILLLSFILIAFFSPITSNDYFTNSGDVIGHTSAIWQAKLAIKQGQFPIRTLPQTYNGWGEAWFQFYSPFAYMTGGLINTFIYPHNPYIAYKLALWLSLLLGGFYLYLLVNWLIRSPVAGLLAAIIYMISPYILLNLYVRGDFTEAFAQGIVPIVVYYTLRSYYDSFRIGLFLKNALFWSLLAMSCIITYVYTSFFLGLLLTIVTLFSYKNSQSWKNLIFCGLSYALGCLLAMWYLAPAGIIEPYLNIGSSNYYDPGYTFLTQIATLFSPRPVSPMPLPGNGAMAIPLYVSVGWPILVSVGVLIYYILENKQHITDHAYKLALALLIVFFLAFFVTWSPINFWQYLPKFLTITQFNYRLLTQVTWIGSLIFAYALFWLFKSELDARHLVFGLLVIGLFYGAWLPTQLSGSSVNLYKDAVLTSDFLVNSDRYKISNLGNTEIFDKVPAWVQNGQQQSIPLNLPANEDQKLVMLKLLGTNMVFDKKPLRLTAIVNGIPIISNLILKGNFQWDIPISEALKRNDKLLTIEFDSNEYFVPHEFNAKNPDKRKLVILLNSLKLSGLPADQTALSANTTEKSCINKKFKKICDVVVSKEEEIIQLPVLYYPELLNITVNGKKADYFPTKDGTLIVASLKLLPGTYKIESYFEGLKWANWISGTVLIILLLGLAYPVCRKVLVNKKVSV